MLRRRRVGTTAVGDGPGAAGAPGPTDGVAVAFRGIDKRFPGVHAVRAVDLDVGVGRIHGLVGENGAGKSTLVKLLTGVHLPDAGTIDVLGVRLRAGDPVASRRAGVAAVYQETTIVPRLSPIANVFLGQDLRRLGILSEREMARRFAELRDLVGVRLPESGPAGALSVGAQKAIEILRALQQGARVIVMDEPTAVMPPAERDAFYATARLLRDQGAAIVFISHNLDEVLDLCDAVTVMRDGEHVLTEPAARLDRAALVEAMLGRALDTSPVRPPAGDRLGGQPVLRVRGLSLPGRLHGIDLDVRAGELLGVAGLVGAGRTSLLRALSGLEPDAMGAIEVAGEARRWPRSPHEALRLGIALAPEDRRTQGLVLSLPAAENVVLPSLRRDAVRGFISRARARTRATDVAGKVGFAASRLAVPAGTLSGGNQQKLVLAKWLHRPPRVLLVDEPVRGIDVGAKAEIFALLARLAHEGMAVVMVSEEIEDLHAVCDRIDVLARGRLTARLDPRSDDVGSIMRAMFETRAA